MLNYNHCRYLIASHICVRDDGVLCLLAKEEREGGWGGGWQQRMPHEAGAMQHSNSAPAAVAGLGSVYYRL